MPYVLTSRELSPEVGGKLGGKGIHLAEMINAGFPVPECFFITTDSYTKFVEANNLKKKIMDIISKADFSDIESLTNASEKIKEIFMKGVIPEQIKDAIIKSYKALAYNVSKDVVAAIELISARTEKPFVAVRSSSVLEDIAKTSAAGQQETYLNVKGEDELLESVKKCWASLYTARAIYYRHKNDQPQDTLLCVIVQRMVNSESSGVSFTVDPTRPVEGANRIVSEACWGLGETIVQGEVEPDRYSVDKKTGDIIEKILGHKKLARIRDSMTGKTIKIMVPENKINVQVLTDDQIVTLSAYCKKIEEYYKTPQDIEWGTERGKIYILQSRDVTRLEEIKEREGEKITNAPLVKGYGASPGFASGIVRVVKDLSELNKIQKGDVLVTKMTSPDMVPAMEKSTAIVTDEGGATCHAAIVSRELGIPCIVGTTNATNILKDGMKITVDATHGIVYAGEISAKPSQEAVASGPVSEFDRITATEIKTNLAFPETAEKGKDADGVGLLRLEHLLTKGGMHPIEYIRQNRDSELTNMIYEGVGTVARVFNPKPVWVRTLDARTDEFRNMQGGTNEPTEDNPMLGWHGIRRDLDEPRILRAQFEAIKRLHEAGLTNVGIMIPFSCDISELKRAKEAGREMGLPSTVKFGIMVEVPSCALSIEDYCKEGIDFISFGSNDLTQLTMGIDRNNQTLIKLFNEMHPGMQFLFRHVIQTCKKYGVKSSICGEAPSNRFDIVDFLVRTGIDSLSVNIDAIEKVRGWVAKIERKMILEKIKS